MSLRKDYLTEWRIWYSMTYKAERDEVPIKTDWLNFEFWLDEVGPRPAEHFQFCRDNYDTAWNEETAGWREMPGGRQDHPYGPYYHTCKATRERLKFNRKD